MEQREHSAEPLSEGWPEAGPRGTLSAGPGKAAGVSLFPESLDGALDLILAAAQPVLVVHGLAFFTWERDREAERDLAHLARSNGVAVLAHAPHPHWDALAIWRDDLPALLRGTYQWNLQYWDAPRTPSDADLRRLIREAGMGEPSHRAARARPMLGVVAGARLYASSHDNSFLSVGAAAPRLPRAVLDRHLRAAVAGALAGLGGRPGDPDRVAPVPEQALDVLWSRVPDFNLRVRHLPGGAGGERVHLGFDSSPPGFFHGRHQPNFVPRVTLDYAPAAARWTVKTH